MEKVFYSRREAWPDRFKGFADAYIRARDTGEEKTNQGRRYDYGYFAEHLDRLGIEYLRDVTPAVISTFLRWREEIGESRATVERRFFNIKTIFKFAKELGIIEVNPAGFVAPPPRPASPPNWLKEEEAEFVQGSVNLSGFRNIRTEFCIRLLVATGLRIGEAVALNLSQVDVLTMTIRDVLRKRERFQSFPLPSPFRDLLILYLQARNAEIERRFPGHRYLGSEEQGRFPLIISNYGAREGDPESFRANDKTIREQFKRKLPELKPHRLRHTFGHEVYDSTKDIVLTARALGHSQLSTTRRYTEPTEEEIRRAVDSLPLLSPGGKTPKNSE